MAGHRRFTGENPSVFVQYEGRRSIDDRALEGKRSQAGTARLDGQEAEWIALVCLHSGVFTRAQFCQYFDTAGRVRAHRFVKTLLARKQAVETEWPTLNNGGKTCRISNKAIYRALGVENIRHRRRASDLVVMRRLLSLDFVLEHPGMNWLPPSRRRSSFLKRSACAPLDSAPDLLCMVGNQKRYFALKLPLAVDPKIVTFAYVDPGHQTDTELYSWGAAHGPLWDALRKKGRQVRVIGIAVENAILDRTDRVLETWAAADPGTSDEGLTPKQEINAIRDAMKQDDEEFLARYGGFAKAGRRVWSLCGSPKRISRKG